MPPIYTFILYKESTLYTENYNFYVAPIKKNLHFKDQAFLRQLGEHCRKLRIQAGYSIDRMAKEGEQLSPSVIQRLEAAEGAVTVMTLYRFAKVLNIDPQSLLNFIPQSSKNRILSADDSTAQKEAFKKYLPFYSLKAAAGYFGRGEAVEHEGWVEVSNLRLNSKMFVAQARGESMEPKIHDQDLVLFQAHPIGTRQGKIVLAQYRGPADPDTGGSYTIKKYKSTKLQKAGSWQHATIRLEPLNPKYKVLTLKPKDKEDFSIIAEFIKVV